MEALKKYGTHILVLVNVVLIAILIVSGSCAHRQRKIDGNNIKALTDSVKTLELKNGDLAYEKQSLIIDKKELEDYLGISKQEVRDLERKLDGALALIAKLQGNVHVDTLLMTDSIFVVDSIKHINFKYTDEWLTMDGTTRLVGDQARTTLNSLDMNAPLKVGLTDNYRVFVTTPNPYLSFSEIDAAAIEGSVAHQKPKRWNVGVQLGFGVGYDILHNALSVGPYAGVGLSYGFGF